MRTYPTRSRSFALAAAAVSLVALACSGGDDGTATATSTTAAVDTPAPTASPLASVPDPIIVTGTGLPGGGETATEDAVEYVVESGDTILAIADRFGVDPELIRQANDIENDEIFIGQTLQIPRGGSVPADSGDSTDGDSTTDAGDGQYVVQPGDTAFGIALEFDITVEALAAANGMTEDEITDLQIGQVINLPDPQ